MATQNDYKVLQKKCIKHFEIASNILNLDEEIINKKTDSEKARFGFYYFILQNTTELNEYEEITDIIYDTDFQKTFFNNANNDEGIDAIYINNENKSIKIYSFKYRNQFKKDQSQSQNEFINSSKFLNILHSRNNDTKGKLKESINKILKCYTSNEEWSTTYYFVSNENITLSSRDKNITNIEEVYDINVEAIGLNEITEFMSLRPEKIDASLVLPPNKIMSYTNNSLSSNTSFIISLPLTELVRITCKKSSYRKEYNFENDELLLNESLENNLLFDNVRGYILRSKYNGNIITTLSDSPENFFYYNNGLTIVAEDIISTSFHSNTRQKLEIKNFQVLNGGQTLNTIHKFNRESKKNMSVKLSKAEILIRILKITDEDLKNNIGEYTNSQNAINHIDLISIKKEQIQLEQYLSEHNILYIRKKGATGEDKKKYKTIISVDKLGQILLSLLGKPHEISNHKKDIFCKHYDELFKKNENLLSPKTVNSIYLYQDITKSYKESKYSGTVQKYMYIIYLQNKTEIKNISKIIEKFEKFIVKYDNEMNNESVSKARFLIFPLFLKELNSYFKI